MMSTQHTTPPKPMLTDMLVSLNTKCEDGCFEAIRQIGKWAAEEKVSEIILPLDEALHETLRRRLRLLQKQGIVPNSLIFTLVAATSAA